MSTGIVLIAFGLVSVVGGGPFALNLRGAATSLKHRAEAREELRRQARGLLGPAPSLVSTLLFRILGSVVAVCGGLLILAGTAELLL
ncbi:hypothetical protein [Streptomyces sp. NPDC051567]|uniref:hypothetical protein n=1 Tax=Streptomyces sp. NPDC051567 TaxID=3365660 RepID=UPI00379390CD